MKNIKKFAVASLASLIAMSGFVGIDNYIPIKVRDVYSGLDLQAGKNHLNGRDALKYVRSCHPEYFLEGNWQSIDEYKFS